MELTIALIISILSIVFTILSFAFGRKDKAKKESAEEASKQSLIEYRLDELSKKVDKILDKLDFYDTEIDAKIEKAMKNHVAQYHNR